MATKNILGMVAGYYLSRDDDLAYEHLGFGNKRVTHKGHCMMHSLCRLPESSLTGALTNVVSILRSMLIVDDLLSK